MSEHSGCYADSVLYVVALRNTLVVSLDMEIRNIRHKGLRGLVERNTSKGLQQDYVAKITDIMTFLIEMEDINEVFDLQKYKPHLLGGDRAGTYSFHVTANWRITFMHDADENELYDIDYEDYH